MNKYLLFLYAIFVAGCGSDESNPENSIGNARLALPSQFTFTEGPVAPELDTFEYQSLMVISSETNDITCRVVMRPSGVDIGASEAFTELEAVSPNINFTSITGIDVSLGIAQEAVAEITDAGGTTRTSVNRWYYFPASNIAGELSLIYSVGCGTPMADYIENQKIINGVLNSVRWEFQ